MPERGARDALAFAVMVWIIELAKGRKVAVYCSDVSGAFDRVELQRMIKKLEAKKIDPAIIALLTSWLRNRQARVLVGGQFSESFDLSNMVFQGTVWGPTLWNMFYEDARRAVNEVFFKEIIYADDLNAYRAFTKDTSNEHMFACMRLCQKELHDWGKANQVSFDPAKESFHVLARAGLQAGKDFKFLGVTFDATLAMDRAVSEVVVQAGWKLKTLIRTRRFYTDAELISLYKAHMLSYLEYRTPAIYHAKRDALQKIDRIQSKFLNECGVDEITALMEFNLAPLAARRDIAMLGLIHRTMLGKGPLHFKDLFARGSNGRLVDPRQSIGGELVKRSALGLVAIYNLLPERCTRLKSVNMFQKELQTILKEFAIEGGFDWADTFSPRVALNKHPLKKRGFI